MSERRVWRCRTYKKQFSVITNIIMHGTKVALRIWVMVIFEMMASKNGVAAREVERKYGITPCSAWFMLHRIREAMSHDDAHLFTGNVVADETFIGGEPKNRHANAKGRNSHARQKTPVMALINADTGEARSKVIADVSARTLRSQIVKNVDLTSATLHSDGWRGYETIGRQFASHQVVDHHIGQYTSEKSPYGTNMAENYFSQLKRSLDGTHHHVSAKHLNRYVDEFGYRYSTCDLNDAECMADFATRVAGRLTYKVVKTPTRR
jgi:hypothetical protein